MQGDFVMITGEAFEMLNQKMDMILNSISGATENKQQWLTNEDVMKMLGISKSTLQVYRDTQKIKFSQIGRKILYSTQDVNELLESFKVQKSLRGR